MNKSRIQGAAEQGERVHNGIAAVALRTAQVEDQPSQEAVASAVGRKFLGYGIPGKKSSEYLTFRIMIEGQQGWVVPAQPGRYILKKVADETQTKAGKIFDAALNGAGLNSISGK
ncbi:MAG: hypothetical protein LBH31_09050 [Burkholderiaceae bacterium]|jgi:hypothetical protein|nr:hypothetical protein [Burkholderiaceae bacterium]